MKKLLLGLFVFSFLIVGARVHASTLDDLMLKIDNLTKEITELKSSLKASAINVSVVAPITPTTDLTPRISVWPGKVNQHVDIDAKMWNTDPDGVSGAGIDKLTYCKKWYPNTISVVQYKIETINAWHARYNIGDYPGTIMSYKCVQNNILSITVTSPNSGFEVIEVGKKLEIRWDSNIAINALVDVYVSDGTNKGTVVRTSNNGALGLIYTLSSNLIPGSNYKAYVSLVSETPVVDSSDKPFTIKSVINDSNIPSITILSPNGGEVYKVGDKINISLSGGLYMTRVGLIDPNFNPNNKISDGNDVHWLSVASDAGKSFIWDGSSFIDNDGNKNYFNSGAGNYKIVAIRDVNDSKCYKNKISDCVFDISDNYFTISKSVSKTSSITRTLKKGIKGEDVKTLQEFLNLTVDGSFGYQTQKKVMEWQAENGLKVDGLFGSQSLEKAGL